MIPSSDKEDHPIPKPYHTLRNRLSPAARARAAAKATQARITCAFCPAFPTYVAAHSDQAGAPGTVTWVLICDDHAADWNAHSDWDAPAFALGPLTAL